MLSAQATTPLNQLRLVISAFIKQQINGILLRKYVCVFNETSSGHNILVEETFKKIACKTNNITFN